MLPVINLGPMVIQTPGFLLLIGLWLGLILAERYSPTREIRPSDLYNLSFTALIFAILGARLAYVLRYPTAFAENPMSLLSLNPGLLDPWGALVCGLLVIVIYGQRKKLQARPLADTITPILAVAAVFVHLSNLASGKAFGTPTTLPWSITLWGALRHPVQAYEVIAAVFILFAIWPGRKSIQSLQPGTTFLVFVSLSTLARLILETFRGDSAYFPGGIRSAQVIAWIILALCLWALGKLRERKDG